MPTPAPQKFLNGEVHDWYRIVLGFSDHLVSHLLDKFDVKVDGRVIDPFCGTGTTLIECMKRGIRCTGIDANPSSAFAARTKTNWTIDAATLRVHLEQIEAGVAKYLRRRTTWRHDPTFQYLDSAGMLERGWICLEPLRKSLALKATILQLDAPEHYRNVLMLTLLAEVVEGASNVKFGPQLYCGPAKEDVDVLGLYLKRANKVIADIAILPSGDSHRQAQVLEGDARVCGELLDKTDRTSYSAVISSPPYPTEHDYTRHSRLELAFLEMVPNKGELQKIKRGMIRSHTKGIYKGDSDAPHSERYCAVQSISAELEVRVKQKSHGFAKLYPTLVRQYFGGMKRHLSSIRPFLQPGALCAYVVGDQSSFLQVHIPTAEILGEIACDVGYEQVEIAHWRSRWSSATSRVIDENILILRVC